MKSTYLVAVCLLVALTLWWSTAREVATPVTPSTPVADSHPQQDDALPPVVGVQREIVAAQTSAPIAPPTDYREAVHDRATSDSWLLTVVVVDERSQPVANAEVSLSAGAPLSGGGFYGGRKGSNPRILTTDGSGRAEHRLLRSEAAVSASKQGVGDSSRVVVLRSATAEAEEIVLRLESTVQLRGVVMRIDGSPLPGASVATKCFNFCRPRRGGITNPDDVISDGQGRFEVAVRVGVRYCVTATIDDQNTMPAYAAIADRSPAEIVLVLPGAITVGGVVLDPTGMPVADAKVVAFRDVDFAEKLESATDEAGCFRIPLPVLDSYRVVAKSSAWASSEAVTVVPNDVRSHVQVGLRLQAFSPIRGRVVSADGQPLVGATVDARPHDDRRVLGNSALDPATRFGVPSSTTTDDNGYFSLLADPASLFTVDVMAQGFECVRRRGVHPGDGELLIVVGKSGCVVRGLVTRSDGQELSDYEVHVERRIGPVMFYSRAEPDMVGGRFSFSSSPKDNEILVRVVPADPSLAPAVRGPFLTNVTEVELSFRLSPWANVTFEVVDASARPILGARVVLHEPSGSNEPGTAVARGWTDSHGRIRLERVPPGRSQLRVCPVDKPEVVREIDLLPGANSTLVVQLQ